MKFSIMLRAATLSLLVASLTGCTLIRHEKVIHDITITTDGTVTTTTTNRVVPIGVAMHPIILFNNGKWEPEVTGDGLMLWPPRLTLKQISADGTVTDHYERVVEID